MNKKKIKFIAQDLSSGKKLFEEELSMDSNIKNVEKFTLSSLTSSLKYGKNRNGNHKCSDIDKFVALSNGYILIIDEKEDAELFDKDTWKTNMILDNGKAFMLFTEIKDYVEDVVSKAVLKIKAGKYYLDINFYEVPTDKLIDFAEALATNDKLFSRIEGNYYNYHDKYDYTKFIAFYNGDTNSFKLGYGLFNIAKHIDLKEMQYNEYRDNEAEGSPYTTLGGAISNNPPLEDLEGLQSLLEAYDIFLNDLKEGK